MRKRIQRHGMAIILGAILLATLALGLWARSQANRWPTGDEPNYAIMAQQLVRHGNFDLKQAFSEKAYVGVFYGWEVEPQINKAYFSNFSPKWYSIHSVGEALLVAPAIIIASALRVSPLYCSIVLTCILGALTAAALYLLCYELTKNKVASALAVGILVLSTSFLSLTGTMFPDLPTAFLLIVSVLYVSRLRGSQRAAYYAITSLCAVLLTIFHAKNILISLTLLGLLLLSFIHHKVGVKRFVCALVPAAILGFFYLFKIHSWYSTWVVTAPFSNGQLFILPFGWSIVASLFDSTKGLLFNNPAFFLIFAGFPIWFKKDRSSLMTALLLVVPSLIIQSTFNDWAGGYSPIGRYLLAYFVVLIPSIAFLWQVIGCCIAARILFFGLLAIQTIMALVYMARGYMWNYAGEPNPLLANIQHYTHIHAGISNPIFSYSAGVTSSTRAGVLFLEVVLSVGLFVWGYRLAKVQS